MEFNSKECVQERAAGMTLVETLMALGIGSIVLLITTTGVSIALKSQRLTEKNIAVEQFRTAAMAALTSEASCRSALGGLNVSSIVSPNSGRLDLPFLKVNGNPILTRDERDRSFQLSGIYLAAKFNQYPNGGTSAAKFSGNPIESVRMLQVDYVGGGTAPMVDYDKYLGFLVISVLDLGDGIGSKVKHLPIAVNLVVERSTSLIKSCSRSMDEEALLAEFCAKGMGGKYDPSLPSPRCQLSYLPLADQPSSRPTLSEFSTQHAVASPPSDVSRLLVKDPTTTHLMTIVGQKGGFQFTKGAHLRIGGLDAFGNFPASSNILPLAGSTVDIENQPGLFLKGGMIAVYGEQPANASELTPMMIMESPLWTAPDGTHHGGGQFIVHRAGRQTLTGINAGISMDAKSSMSSQKAPFLSAIAEVANGSSTTGISGANVLIDRDGLIRSVGRRSRLHIVMDDPSSDGYGFGSQNDGSYPEVTNSMNPFAIYVRSSGGVGGGFLTFGRGGRMTVGGPNAGYATASDRRLKTEIKQIESPLDRLLEIKGYSYRFKNGSSRHLGVIAQDVQKVFPELVSEEIRPQESNDHANRSFLTVAYEGLIAPLIESVRELASRLRDGEERLHQLQEKVRLQEEQIVRQQQVMEGLSARLEKIEHRKTGPFDCW